MASLKTFVETLPWMKDGGSDPDSPNSQGKERLLVGLADLNPLTWKEIPLKPVGLPGEKRQSRAGLFAKRPRTGLLTTHLQWGVLPDKCPQDGTVGDLWKRSDPS